MKASLRVSEIFRSLQGEGTRAGLPCVLVRLAGCNLHCAWCDTPQARDRGEQMSVADVLRRVAELRCPRVQVTGGEPLVQPAATELLRRLCEAGYETLLETNGSLDTAPVDPRVVRIVDVKCPASGEGGTTHWANIERLRRRDEVKFVLADRADYEFARDVVARYGLTGKCPVIFSPVHGVLAGAALAEWVLADGPDVRVGLQLHKIIWPERLRGA